MGMFDEIKVEVILPDRNEIVDTWFQTKSLEKMMEEYVITGDGQLCQNKWDYEYVYDANYFLGGYLSKIDASYRRICLDEYHGDVIFYDSVDVVPDGSRVYRDYIARFTNGKLEKITYKDMEYGNDLHLTKGT